MVGVKSREIDLSGGGSRPPQGSPGVKTKVDDRSGVTKSEHAAPGVTVKEKVLPEGPEKKS